MKNQKFLNDFHLHIVECEKKAQIPWINMESNGFYVCEEYSHLVLEGHA